MIFIKKILYPILLNILLLIFFTTHSNANYSEFKPSKFSKNNEIVIEAWNSLEGIKRLENSKYKKDFYKLAGFFQPQINPLYCGMASSVIILNALNSNDKIESQKNLEVVKPEAFGGGLIPFQSYSQITFLNEETDKVKDRRIIELENLNDNKSNLDPGVSLTQLSNILRKSYGLKVKKKHVSKYSQKELTKFRNLIKKVLNDEKRYILVNFKGDTIGLKTLGHISPIAAYDEKSDSILVLDVAGHKNPWYWVKTKYLFLAMNTKDGGNYRGYLLIKN